MASSIEVLGEKKRKKIGTRIEDTILSRLLQNIAVILEIVRSLCGSELRARLPVTCIIFFQNAKMTLRFWRDTASNFYYLVLHASKQ